jgi:hypothetical protein
LLSAPSGQGMLLALEQKVVRSHVCFEPITTLLCDCLSDTFQPHRPTAARSSKALPLLSLCVTKIQGNEAFRLRKAESGTSCSKLGVPAIGQWSIRRLVLMLQTCNRHSQCLYSGSTVHSLLQTHTAPPLPYEGALDCSSFVVQCVIGACGHNLVSSYS